MSGPQTFHQKVTIPLAVILATVGGLFLVGTQLMGIDPNPVADEAVVETSLQLQQLIQFQHQVVKHRWIQTLM